MNKNDMFEKVYKEYSELLQAGADHRSSGNPSDPWALFMPIMNMSAILVDMIKERYCSSNADIHYRHPMEVIRAASAADPNIDLKIWLEFSRIRNVLVHKNGQVDLSCSRLTDAIVPEFVREYEYLTGE